MLGIAVSLVGLVSAPVLLFFAWRGWATGVRAELPPWRNGVCISALLLLSLNWVGAAVLEAPVFVRPQISRPPGLLLGMFTLSLPLDVVGIVLALALRRAPRVQVILAGLLMLVSWPLGYA